MISFKNLFTVFSIFATLSFNAAYAQNNPDNFKKPLPHQLEREVQVPEIPDHIRLLTPNREYAELGVDAQDMARYIRQVGEAFESVFESDMRNESKKNAVVAVLVDISGIENPKEVCTQDYTKCVLLQVAIDSAGIIEKSKLQEFNKRVMEIKEIKISQNNKENHAAFLVYMNTKPESIKAPEPVKPSFSCKPPKDDMSV